MYAQTRMHYPLPAPLETEQIEPSLWYTLFGFPFIAIGIFIAAYTFVAGVRQITANVTQVVVPGGVILALQPGQTYTVFQEKGAVVQGRTYADWPALGSMLCTVRKVSTNQLVELRKPAIPTTYSWGKRQGVSIADFAVPSSGQYDFTCEKKDPGAAPEGVVAVGDEVGRNMGKMLVQSFTALFAGGGLGLAMVLIVIAQRDRSKRRIRARGLRPV
jgi:hypothetical protein